MTWVQVLYIRHMPAPGEGYVGEPIRKWWPTGTKYSWAERQPLPEPGARDDLAILGTAYSEHGTRLVCPVCGWKTISHDSVAITRLRIADGWLWCEQDHARTSLTIDSPPSDGCATVGSTG